MHAVEKQMNICHSQLENKINQNTGVTQKAFAKIMLPPNLEGLNLGIKVVDHCLFSTSYSFGGIGYRTVGFNAIITSRTLNHDVHDPNLNRHLEN